MSVSMCDKRIACAIAAALDHECTTVLALLKSNGTLTLPVPVATVALLCALYCAKWMI